MPFSVSASAARTRLTRLMLAAIGGLASASTVAGPPYVADDPEPTNFQHYEIYLFANAKRNADGTAGATGIDFNYGGAPDLQLTAVLPVAFDRPHDQRATHALGNVELAAKYRFLHQAKAGWDVAIFPRLFLPSASKNIGERHGSLLLPLWLQRDWGPWSTFGGGGCTANRGGDSQDFCLAAWALARQVTPALQIGAELQHQGADTHGGHASSSAGIGLRYDARPWMHLLGYGASGLQNRDDTFRYSVYTALLLTF